MLIEQSPSGSTGFRVVPRGTAVVAPRSNHSDPDERFSIRDRVFGMTWLRLCWNLIKVVYPTIPIARKSRDSLDQQPIEADPRPRARREIIRGRCFRTIGSDMKTRVGG